MAKLADIDSEIRVILKIAGIALVVVAAIFIFINGAQIFKNIFFPTPPPPPEEKFGKLPPLAFPSQSPQGFTYRINTLSGKLPALPDRMKVYKVNQVPASLVALTAVRESIRNVGYSQAETKISEAVYKWGNSNGTVITYNTVNNNFRISSNFLSAPAPQRITGSAATGSGAYDEATRFIQSIGGDVKDLDPTTVRAIYLKIENGSLIEATSQSDAQFIRVDLYQKPLDKRNIYYSAQNQSPMYFIFKDEGGLPQIVDGAFFHYSASSESSEYAIKASDQAFNDLKLGNAFVLSEKRKDGPIDITDVTLGYYIGDSPEYFLPIIVFHGDGFVAFVNALSSSQ